jgi:transposase
MNNITSQVGIDVAKDMLDVSIDQAKPFRITNSEPGISKFIPTLPVGCVVYVEASGGYERLLRRMLNDAGITCVRHDPLRVRRLAQSQSINAKTDALDARILSSMGSKLPVREAKSKEKEDCTDISRAVEDLKAQAADLKKKARAPELEPGVKKSFLRVVKTLEKEATKLQEKFEIACKKCQEVQNRYELGQTVPGVGPNLARTCACELPDLRGATTAQISAYGAVAPLDRSSGKKQGFTSLGRGCVRIKRALYMPALSAVRHQVWATTLYKKLRKKGKSHQSAMIAVMRRLLVRIAAVLIRGSAWQPEPPRP